MWDPMLSYYTHDHIWFGDLFHNCHYFPQAISSLKKYPLPLKNGKEAKILQNFGDGICKFLDDRLEKYYRENGELILKTEPSYSIS